jgi:hypothetical protein
MPVVNAKVLPKRKKPGERLRKREINNLKIKIWLSKTPRFPQEQQTQVR